MIDYSSMNEIKEVNEDKLVEKVDAKTIQFEEAKEKWQQKRLNEINEIR